MDQQSPLPAATVLPARVPGDVPPTPPRLPASSRHIPTPVWSGRMSSPPDHDGASDSPPTPNLTLASDNYTFAAHHAAPPAGAPPRPYHFDSYSFATPHDFLRHGRSNDPVPTWLPDLAADRHGAASLREPAASSGSQGEAPTQASASPTSTLDADASRIRLGDESGTAVTNPLQPAGNPNVVVHAIQNGSVSEGPRTATAVVACHRPRTHTAAFAHGHPADDSGNNYAGYSSQSGSDNHDSHQDGERDDDINDRRSDDEPEEDGQGEPSGAGSKTNRPAQRAPNGPLNCPYWRRNKQRFNVRDHVDCTKPFKGFTSLKKHIRETHKLPQGGSETDDVEDGIPQRTVDLLRKRKHRVKVCTWEKLWAALFPNDVEIPPQAYEPCIEAATDEFIVIADTARLHAKDVVLAQLSDLRAAAADPAAFVGKIDLIYKECYAHSCRDFEHKVLVHQAPPAHATVPGPSRRRSKRSNQPGNQGNHGSGRQTPSNGTSSQHGDHQVHFRHIAPLAPSPVRDHTLAPLPPSQYPPHGMPHQQQGHVQNLFPLAGETGYQGWPSQTTQGRSAFVAPTPDQYHHGFQSAHMSPPPSGWMGGSSAGHRYPVNMQHNQSLAAGSFPEPHPRSIASHASHASHQRPFLSDFPGTHGTRQQAPSTYGPYPNRHSRHSGFAGWPDSNSTTDNNGNPNAN